MPLPSTYLSQAPLNVDNQLGKCMSSSELLKKLKRCNKQLVAPTPEQVRAEGLEFAGGHLEGQTSLYWGQPATKGHFTNAVLNSTKPHHKGLKIVSFVLGPAIPEFTQFNISTGEIVQKGWREILRRVVMSGAATKEKVEKVFKVSLDYGGQENVCLACSKKGLRTKANGRKNLCVDHEMATLGISERQDYIDYLRRQFYLRGESQVGYTKAPKEDACHSLPLQEEKPRPRMSGRPLEERTSQGSTPSPKSAPSGLTAPSASNPLTT